MRRVTCVWHVRCVKCVKRGQGMKLGLSSEKLAPCKQQRERDIQHGRGELHEVLPLSSVGIAHLEDRGQLGLGLRLGLDVGSGLRP